MSGADANSIKVLVVEDDRNICQQICRHLRTRGYHAEGVAAGREALTRLEQEDFVAVVADLSLARTHDLDLPREIQGLAEFRPWVIYVGVPEPSGMRWRTERGVFCVMMKGAPIRDLLWSVEAACRAASTDQQARCA
jgi:DNA-binding NtrC family response regulator